MKVVYKFAGMSLLPSLLDDSDGINYLQYANLDI